MTSTRWTVSKHTVIHHLHTKQMADTVSRSNAPAYPMICAKISAGNRERLTNLESMPDEGDAKHHLKRAGFDIPRLPQVSSSRMITLAFTPASISPPFSHISSPPNHSTMNRTLSPYIIALNFPPCCVYSLRLCLLLQTLWSCCNPPIRLTVHWTASMTYSLAGSVLRSYFDRPHVYL